MTGISEGMGCNINIYIAATEFILDIASPRKLNLTGKELKSLFGVRSIDLPARRPINPEVVPTLKKETLVRVGMMNVYIKSLEALMPIGENIFSTINSPLSNEYFQGRSIREALLEEAVSMEALVKMSDYFVCKCNLIDQNDS